MRLFTDLSALKVPHYGDGSNLAFWEGVIEKKYEYAGYDGWYNNRAHPDWGAAGNSVVNLW